jgi:tetratricopeptide (TPR) repeat protein
MNIATRRRRLNLRFLILVVVVTPVLGAGVHLLHNFQVRRNCQLLKEQIDRADAAGQLETAGNYLRRYMGLAPDDADTVARHVLLVEKLAKKPVDKYRAYLAFQDTLTRYPDADLTDLRRRTAEVALTLTRTADAREQLLRVLQHTPDDPDIEDLLGQCEEADRHFDAARKAYAAALAHAPKRVATAVRLAYLLRGELNPATETEKTAEADKVMDALVRNDPESADARIARSRYRQTFGDLYLAEKDLAQVRQQSPSESAELLVASAELADTRGQTDAARKHLEQGRKNYPNDVRFPVALARLELRGGTEHRATAAGLLRDAARLAPDDAETLWTIADLFLDAGETSDARTLLDRMRTKHVPEAATAYVEARLFAAEQQYGAAVALLERSGAPVTTADTLGFLCEKSNLLLATWYERLGNPERQLAAYERVLRANPGSRTARAGKAAVLVTLGSADAAVPIYRGLIAEVPALRLNLARLLLAHNATLPPGRREWAEVETLLDEAPPAVRALPEHRLTAIDLLALSGKLDEAIASADEACKLQPNEVRFWLARAALADHGERPDPLKALAVLAEAQGSVGDTVELRLARAERLVGLPPDDARGPLRALEKNGDQFPAAERGRLEIGLADAHARLRDLDDAARLLRQAADRLPHDPGIRDKLFDLAMLAGDEAAADKQFEELRRIEGDEGVLWRSREVARNVLAAQKGDPSALTRARRQLVEVERRRPGWGRTLVLEAQVDELEGRTDLALENYRKAIDRGERRTWVVRKAVELLAVRRRPEDARDLLQKFVARVPSAGTDSNRLLVEMTGAGGQAKEESLEIARAAVSPDSKDYRDFLWLGQLLSTLGEPKQAEAALRTAIRLNDAAADARVALIVLLAETGRPAAARATLEEAKRVLPKSEHPALLAPALEVLGDLPGAEAAYVALTHAAPDSAAAKYAQASFYLRTSQLAKAEPLLRSLAQGDSADAARARRALALVLARSGDFTKSGEALRLLDVNLGGRWSGPDDERARAIVLALRPGDRAASIQALEDSFRLLKPTAAEEFLLAKLYDADGKWPRAREHLHTLVSTKEGNNPDVLAFAVSALLRQHDPAEARTWQTELEAREPNSERTVVLKTRLLAAEGNSQVAAQLIGEFCKRQYAKDKDPAVLARCAGVLVEIGRPVEAEAVMRNYVAEAQEARPECFLTMAYFLARRDHAGEALDFCDRAAARCNTEAVADTAVAVLRLSRPTAAERDHVRNWLDEELRKTPASAGLLVSRADLFEQYGDYASAERIYRDVLARQPNNVAALNNLAWLVAVQAGKGEEALELIGRALELAGPIAGLLDTQACVYLAMDRPEQAVGKLEQAVSEEPTGTRYFHLALALSRAGRGAAAGDAWRKAVNDQLLTERQVHALERAEFRKLSAEYAKAKP